jgi:GT2 family glycosyltransferase
MPPEVAAVVPSLGVAAGLDEALARLRRELAAVGGELVWVHQGERTAPRLTGPRERLVHLERAAGFARAVERGFAATAAPWVAVVNDDVWLEPGWLATLREAVGHEAAIAAVQGLNLQYGAPERIDGAGLGWNRRWQAVQLGHGELATSASRAPFEVFGVSATAALYRRSALDEVSSPGAQPFDASLESWYEDVDLAVRLAARGRRSLVVPAAKALHRGSATGATMPFRRARLLTRNRWLVTARLLGRRWPAALPAIARGELGDLAALLRSRRWRALAGLPAGWAGAAIRLPASIHLGAPAVALARLAALPSTLPQKPLP